MNHRWRSLTLVLLMLAAHGQSRRSAAAPPDAQTPVSAGAKANDAADARGRAEGDREPEEEQAESGGSDPSARPDDSGATGGRSINEMIGEGRYDKALVALERTLREGKGSLPRRLYQRGLAQAGLGRDREAALSFMRVVIHYHPGDTDAYVPSLIEAGRTFQRLDRSGHARELWNEAKGLSGDQPRRLDTIEKLLRGLAPERKVE